MNETDIEAIRAEFPALKHEIYLNSGTYGAMPTVVGKALREWYTMLEWEGPWTPPAMRRSDEEYESTRHKLAALLSAQPDEIALTTSVTAGSNIVAHGLHWQPGDEVIISDQEHESGWVVWLAAAQRYNLKMRVLPLVADEGELLSRLGEMITPRTRLVFLSHVSCQSGLKIPAAAIGRLAHERGALFMLDGAHAVGAMPVNPRALNCDFYTACGHKWLMGPQGTGFLYVSREHLEEVEPSWVGAGSRSRECRGPGDERLIWADGAHRYENATRAWPLYVGLGAAVDLIQHLGPAEIEARIQSLVGPFKQALAELPRMRVVTPLDPRYAAGLVSIEFSGYRHEPLTKLYDERRILAPYWRRDDGRQRIRFAVAFFILQRELDLVLETLRELAD